MRSGLAVAVGGTDHRSILCGTASDSISQPGVDEVSTKLRRPFWQSLEHRSASSRGEEL
ncbi:hypothetical protein IG631_18024 [Alternaria alternata]|nr:hypothetical protein IG631_18024 [Alternaria alternata]